MTAPFFREEQFARELGERARASLDAAGLAAKVDVSGEGVHWQVDVTAPELGGAGDRACRVHCFDYGEPGPDAPDVLELGTMANAHLRSASARRATLPRYGVEYAFELRDGASSLGDDEGKGRSSDLDQAVALVAAWLGGAALEAIHARFDFVDDQLRSCRALIAPLEARLRARGDASRLAIETEHGAVFELWVYGVPRTCTIARERDGTIGCGLVLATTQVARVELREPKSRDSLVELVEAWIVDGVSLAEISARYPGVELEAHADLFEGGEIARWLWTQLRESATEGSILRPYVPLFEAIQARPGVARMFAFTSLDRLCFSLCSHFPFASAGLPIVRPTRVEGPPRYEVVAGSGPGSERFEGDAAGTAAVLDRLLAAVEVQPWHGVATDALREPINTELAALGSELRVLRSQRRIWIDQLVQVGDEHMTIHGASDHFCLLVPSDDHPRATPENPREAAEAIVAWARRLT